MAGIQFMKSPFWGSVFTGEEIPDNNSILVKVLSLPP